MQKARMRQTHIKEGGLVDNKLPRGRDGRGQRVALVKACIHFYGYGRPWGCLRGRLRVRRICQEQHCTGKDRPVHGGSFDELACRVYGASRLLCNRSAAAVVE